MGGNANTYGGASIKVGRQKQFKKLLNATGGYSTDFGNKRYTVNQISSLGLV
jgi:hypothetical protein